MTSDHCCAHGSVESKNNAPGAIGINGQYTCPMHLEVLSDSPGDCPSCGMALESMSINREELEDDSEARDLTRRFYISLPLAIGVVVLAMGDLIPGVEFNRWLGSTALGFAQAALTTPVLFWCGWPFLLRGWSSIRNRAFNMWTLIMLGTLAAFGFSLIVLLVPNVLPATFGGGVDAPPLYFEAAAVIITLVILGQILESRARLRTAAAILQLLDLTPPRAVRIDVNGVEQMIDVGDIQLDDRLRIHPGEKIPTDGVVEEGESTIDESMLSGEAMPVLKRGGEAVSAGTLNQNGALVMRATRIGQDTLLAQIISLVASAQRSRAPIQSVADRLAAGFVPLVVSIAVIAFFAWLFFGPAPSGAHALVAAVSVLIIACPCALGLATPMSVTVGIGRGALEGILIRDAEALQTVGSIDVLVCDKTGTITEGRPRVTKVQPAGSVEVNELLRFAAAVEAASEHPLARAVCEAAGSTPVPQVANFESTTGLGVRGTADGIDVALGNDAFMASLDITVPDDFAVTANDPGNTDTHVLVALAGKFEACIAVNDPIKSSSATALGALRASGIRVVIASGDSARVTNAIAQQLSIDEVHAGCLPADKHALIKQYQSEGLTVAMAGDGINDAPALAQADAGIAMGAGSSIAIESAAVTLVKGDLHGVAKSIALSRQTMRNINQNLIFAFAYNAIGVPVAAGVLYPVFGFVLSPMIAAAAMSLSSVSVIANALRLRHTAL